MCPVCDTSGHATTTSDQIRSGARGRAKRFLKRLRDAAPDTIA
jgi:hypothetical protein